MSGIDDDGKKTDAVLKSENNKNNTLDASDEKSHLEADQQPAKENSEVETEVENVKKNVTETVEDEAFLPAEVRLKYSLLLFLI